jgi:hypothetical protein
MLRYIALFWLKRFYKRQTFFSFFLLKWFFKNLMEYALPEAMVEVK